MGTNDDEAEEDVDADTINAAGEEETRPDPSRLSDGAVLPSGLSGGAVLMASKRLRKRLSASSRIPCGADSSDRRCGGSVTE